MALTDSERRDLARAAVFAMDTECDGGTLPPVVAKWCEHSEAPATEKVEREVLAWFYSNAPGNFS